MQGWVDLDGGYISRQFTREIRSPILEMTRQCHDRDSNQRRESRQSNVLTTTPPSHPRILCFINNLDWDLVPPILTETFLTSFLHRCRSLSNLFFSSAGYPILCRSSVCKCHASALSSAIIWCPVHCCIRCSSECFLCKLPGKFCFFFLKR